MWKNRNRTLVTLIAVILAAAVFGGILTMAVSVLDFLIRSEERSAGAYYVRFSYLDEEKAENISKQEAVKKMASSDVLGFVNIEEKESNWSSFFLSGVSADFFEMMPVALTEGRLPQNDREILLPEQAIDVFSHYGLPCAVGETVKLDAVTHYEALSAVLPNEENTAFSRNYTIVGIYEDHVFDESLVLQSLLTCSGNADETLYRNLFVTTKRPMDAYGLAEQYPDRAKVHTRLLSYYGATQYANYNTVIGLIAAAAILIVMIAAVSVIYHAFSVSVSERTKAFGLLCSMGATKKQIRRSVIFEAAVLSCLGIPVGFLVGFGIDALLFHVLGDRIGNLIVSAINESGGVRIEAVLSPAVILGTIFVTGLTVMISAMIPAMRASRAVPMDAIRQKTEYQAEHMTQNIGKKALQAFGVSGMMAKKYNRVSRKKSRPIVISLTLSIVLLMTASSLGNMVETVTATSIRMENHDFRIYSFTEEEHQAILDSGLVTRSALIGVNDGRFAFVPSEDFSEDFRKAFADIQTYDADKALNIQSAAITYVQASVLEEYLLEKGVDPTPYLDRENPTALLCDTRLFTPHFQNENGEWIQYSYRLSPLHKEAESILFLNYLIPREIKELYNRDGGSWKWGYLSENGKILAQMTPYTTSADGMIQMGGFDESKALYFEIVVTKKDDGTSCVSYYPYDRTTGLSENAPVCIVENADMLQEYRIGAHITERPFGVEEPVSGKIEWILPLFGQNDFAQYLAVDTNHYLMFKSFLDEMGMQYTDNCEVQENVRTVRMLIDAVSYGFVFLISVLCLASTLNTVCASVLMRRRDFGMLRSLGFERKKIARILILENAFHGIKAIAVGIPIGLFVHLGIYWIQRTAVITEFTLPWSTLFVSVGSVFIITLLAVFCSLRKLRGMDLMDSLKNENI